MSKLEDIIKQHSNLSSYIEDMNELTRTFETFVYDSYNIKNINSSPISEVTVYSQNDKGKLEPKEMDWFGYSDNKGNNKTFLSIVIPLLAYLPTLHSAGKVELAVEQMSESALSDKVYLAYITNVIADKLKNNNTTDETQISTSIQATIKNLQYKPKESFRKELEVFCYDIISAGNIGDLIREYTSSTDNKFTYIFKKKIYENIQSNYKSWEIFIEDIYGAGNKKTEDIKKQFYNDFRLPDEKDVIGEVPDGITDDDLGLDITVDKSEQLKNGLSPEQLSQWTQISKVWEALKDIKIDGETTFFDALYNAFKSNETVLQQALTTYFRSISPKDGLIFRKGWTQQITTKFIQVIIVACIDDMVNRGAYHNDMRIPEEKLSTLQQKYQNALDHGNTQAIEKLKKEVLNNFGVDARKQLDEMRPKQKQVKSKG